MKKIILLASALVLAYSCSNNNDEDNVNPQQQTTELTASFAEPEDDDDVKTRTGFVGSTIGELGYGVDWKTSDVIQVSDGSVLAPFTCQNQGTTGHFTGTLSGTPKYAFYSAQSVTPAGVATYVLPADQTVDKDNLLGYDHAASNKYIKPNFAFNRFLAVVKLQTKFAAGSPTSLATVLSKITINKITLSATKTTLGTPRILAGTYSVDAANNMARTLVTPNGNSVSGKPVFGATADQASCLLFTLGFPTQLGTEKAGVYNGDKLQIIIEGSYKGKSLKVKVNATAGQNFSAGKTYTFTCDNSLIDNNYIWFDLSAASATKIAALKAMGGVLEESGDGWSLVKTSDPTIQAMLAGFFM